MNYRELFTSYEDAFINDLKGLIQIPSVRDDESACDKAPFGKECRAALDYMLELGRRDGFDVKDIDGYAGVISYGNGTESVGVLAHLDVVPQGEGWSYPPFGGEIDRGVMFGRGTMDDKGPAMAAYYAMKMLKDQNIQTNKKIMLILGCDEESGMQCMDYYKQHGEIPTVGFTPDADFPVIYGEKGGLHVQLQGEVDSVIKEMHAGERVNVVIAQANALLPTWNEEMDTLLQFYLQTNAIQGHVCEERDGYRLHMEGTSAHGAMPYYGNNAAMHIFNFVATAFQDSFSQKTYQLLHDWMGSGLGIAFDGAYMGFLTLNTGIVHVHQKKADIVLDIRYPNDMQVEDIKQAIHASVASKQYPLQVDIHEKAKPLFVDPTSTLVTTLTDVYRTYTNDMTTPNKTIGGGTYAKKFDNFVAFGPEFVNPSIPEGLHVGGVHQADEGVSLNDLFTSIAIYAQSIETLAK